MSESIQSKVNTVLISATLVVAGAGLKFWRDTSITMARLEQSQSTSAGEVLSLRVRVGELENESRRQWAEIQAELLRIKYVTGVLK